MAVGALIQIGDVSIPVLGLEYQQYTTAGDVVTWSGVGAFTPLSVTTASFTIGGTSTFTPDSLTTLTATFTIGGTSTFTPDSPTTLTATFTIGGVGTFTPLSPTGSVFTIDGVGAFNANSPVSIENPTLAYVRWRRALLPA